ncbi:uncharacterized protein BP5553_05732 [Venustampulla echinocandica]|uniref:Late sexual development protein n=1 Tax=Venustampulla echinocandica TaxID=2656787 RepID=A0A370TLH8_9HELO|nr:uncharacterized protein BP5553_05732 [Venustampulla echinocandica]RDL36380.1 hypothetical protein BP5553_05732 [Venustampulla echinocandica]
MFSTLTSSLIAFWCLSTMTSATPFSYDNNPLKNNFPTPSNDQIKAIETQAHGSLPNTAPPATAQQNTLTSLRLIAFNELFEVAFFAELIANITNNVDGYKINDVSTKKSVLASLIAIQAQEELHTLDANNALKHFKTDPIQPCHYDFPVSNLNDAIGLASTFTDMALGVLQDVQSQLGSDGDIGLIRGVGAIIGQEGEQNGLFRQFGNKIPSALPFLTTSTRDFTFSAINQNFVVPNSCPNINVIDLKIFSPLTVDSETLKSLQQNPKPTTLKFSFQLPLGGPKPEWGSDWTGLKLAYINQQNIPVTENLHNVKVNTDTVSFEAPFLFDAATFGNGLTIAAVASASADFSSPDNIAKAPVVFGPGLIEVN